LVQNAIPEGQIFGRPGVRPCLPGPAHARKNRKKGVNASGWRASKTPDRLRNLMTSGVYKQRVLLADDNVVVRSAVRRLSRAHPDFEVSEEAENGLDVLQKAQSLRPDLIMLDLAMPAMNGLEAAPALRKLLPTTRLILLTVHNGPEVERLSREAGLDAVVPKNQASSRLIVQARALLKSSGES